MSSLKAFEYTVSMDTTSYPSYITVYTIYLPNITITTSFLYHYVYY